MDNIHFSVKGTIKEAAANLTNESFFLTSSKSSANHIQLVRNNSCQCKQTAEKLVHFVSYTFYVGSEGKVYKRENHNKLPNHTAGQGLAPRQGWIKIIPRLEIRFSLKIRSCFGLLVRPLSFHSIF